MNDDEILDYIKMRRGSNKCMNAVDLNSLEEVDKLFRDKFLRLIKDKNDDHWPKVGDKVKFLTAEGMFYPHFTNIIANAKEKLHTGGIYIVKKCEVYSSWCAVWLDELGEDGYCHLSMFEYPVKD